MTPISTFEPANLFLETAVQILDPDSNQVVRYLNSFFFPDPQGNPPQFIRREDVSGQCGSQLRLRNGCCAGNRRGHGLCRTAVAVLPDHPRCRRTRSWRGERGNTLALCRSSWMGPFRNSPGKIGPGGAKTHASRNSEHEDLLSTVSGAENGLSTWHLRSEKCSRGAFGLRAAITDPRKS